MTCSIPLRSTVHAQMPIKRRGTKQGANSLAERDEWAPREALSEGMDFPPLSYTQNLKDCKCLSTIRNHVDKNKKNPPKEGRAVLLQLSAIFWCLFFAFYIFATNKLIYWICK